MDQMDFIRRRTGFIRRRTSFIRPTDEASPIDSYIFFLIFLFLQMVLFVRNRSFTIKISVKNSFSENLCWFTELSLQ